MLDSGSWEPTGEIDIQASIASDRPLTYLKQRRRFTLLNDGVPRDYMLELDLLKMLVLIHVFLIRKSPGGPVPNLGGSTGASFFPEDSPMASLRGQPHPRKDDTAQHRQQPLGQIPRNHTHLSSSISGRGCILLLHHLQAMGNGCSEPWTGEACILLCF